MKNKRLIIMLSVALSLLLVPLVAMQFSTEVQWDETDFIVMGGLLLSVALLCEGSLQLVKSLPGRLALCAGILILFLLIWGELAVGIFGTPFAGS